MALNVLNSFGVGESYQYFTNVGPGTGRTYSSVHGFWVLMSTVTVPLNFFQSGDIVTIEAACSKQGSTDNWYLAMFSNTSASLNGARLIGYCMEPNYNVSAAGGVNNGLTYSLIQRRLHIITADGTGEGTWVIDYDYSISTGDKLGYQTHDHYAYSSSSYNRIGSNGTWDNSFGEMVGASTTSMDWISSDNFIIIAGYTGLTDRIRTEWIKVSGKAEGGGGGF
jgi:hypothetical protein